MQAYPHIYMAAAQGDPAGPIAVSSAGLPTLTTAAPREFDGPGDRWSPEVLLCAAIADCFILTFRAIAHASKLQWLNLRCSVEGTLERADGGVQFTRFVTHAELTAPQGVDSERAKMLLEKAERTCLVSNSLRAARTLQASVIPQ